MSLVLDRELILPAIREPRWRRVAKDVGLQAIARGSAVAHRICGDFAHGRFGVLMYHRIAEPVRGLPSPTINVAPRQFRRQVVGLLRQGFVFWPLRRLLARSRAGELIPPRVVALTFDDGFASVHQQAWPTLREFRVPATVFLPTAYVGADLFPFDDWAQEFRLLAPADTFRPLTWDECDDLHESGLIDWGAHTHTHQDFRHRPFALRDDLAENVRVLRARYGRDELPFALPFGTPRLGFAARELLAAAQETGVCCALTTAAELVDPKQSPFGWGRLNVFPGDDGTTLAARLTGHCPTRDRLSAWWTGAPAPSFTLPSPQPSARSATPVKLPPDPATAGGSFSSHPLISIILPTHNRCHWLAEAIESLVNQQTGGEFAFEVVVADNGSTDETRQVVERATAAAKLPIRYVYEERRGDAPARNAALAVARGDWLAFFDDDQLAEPAWLLELWRAARQATAEIVGGSVHLLLDERQEREFGYWLRVALRETRLYDQLHPYVNAWPGAGNALVAKRVFDTIGKFDESFPGGGSDVELFRRARGAGWPLWYTPAAVVRHRLLPERLTPAALRRDAVSGGRAHATYFDWQERGWFGLWRGAAGRLMQATLWHLPWLAWHLLMEHPGEALGQRIRLWRTEGYLRGALHVVGRTWPNRRRTHEATANLQSIPQPVLRRGGGGSGDRPTD